MERCPAYFPFVMVGMGSRSENASPVLKLSPMIYQTFPFKLLLLLDLKKLDELFTSLRELDELEAIFEEEDSGSGPE